MNKNEFDKLDFAFGKDLKSNIQEHKFEVSLEKQKPQFLPVQKYQTTMNENMFKEQHQKKKNITKTKWDEFNPYAFNKLKDGNKTLCFNQLFDDYLNIKLKMQQEIQSNRKLRGKVHILEEKISNFNKKAQVSPKEQQKKRQQIQIKHLKLQIKRLNEKIVALACLPKKIMSKTGSKTIFPINQNLKHQLQIEKKTVRQLSLMIEQLKKQKCLDFQSRQNDNFEKRQRLNAKQPKTEKVQTNLLYDSQKEFMSEETNSWKRKYNDLQMVYRQAVSDKDRKLSIVQTQLTQIKEQQTFQRNLESKNKINHFETSVLQQKIKDLTRENDRLQSEIRRLVQMPFNQSDKKVFQTQQKLNKLQDSYKKIKEQLQKIRQQNASYLTQLEFKKRQNIMLKQQKQNITKQMKQMNSKSDKLDIDLNDYYRQLLRLVKLQGDDPIWHKYANMVNPNFDMMKDSDLKKEAEKLWYSKLQLLAHLEKAQIELTSIKKNQDSRIELYIKDKECLQQELIHTKARLDQWMTMENMSKNKQLKIHEQNGIKYDDSVSVFQTEESELKQLDSNCNYYDLYLGQLNIDEQMLLKNPQNKIKNVSSMISFATIQFYNHGTQHSSFVQGNGKKLNNNYSFYVTMDSNMMRFMSKRTLVIEVWSPQGTNTVLLGRGQVGLKDILRNSIKDISAVLRGKCLIYYHDRTLVATLEYRMRMRLPIASLVEWADDAEYIRPELNQSKKYISASRKTLLIVIVRGQNIPSAAKAFVYFSFQGEDFYTEPQNGPSPMWGFKKELEVHMDDQFADQMRQKYVQFTVFDDERQVNQDVLGVAQANFTPLLNNATQLQFDLDIINNYHQSIGKLFIKAAWI